MKFVDRKASKPNRYKATPENGNPFFMVLERADEPTEEGTPLNAAVLNVMASFSSLSPAMMDDGTRATGFDNSIDDGGGGDVPVANAVLYIEQTLTEEQKAQARANIGIVGTGKDGVDGEDGEDGYTPIRGTDYYTEADKAEMVGLVLAALPMWEGGSY